MKKWIFGLGVALAGFTTSVATADDCCYPMQYDQCCPFDFNGFYLGGNIGVHSHLAWRGDHDEFFPTGNGWHSCDTNVELGVQLGYDWQCCYKVFGLVADWNWVNTDRRQRVNQSGSDTQFVRNEMDWFTTIRARAGVAVCDSLFYITAGAAVASFDNRLFSNATSASGDFHYCRNRWGWTGGVGAEFVFWCNWSLSGEVLFMHFCTDTRRFTASSGSSFEFGFTDSAWVGRILLNYRFGDLCSWCCW